MSGNDLLSLLDRRPTLLNSYQEEEIKTLANFLAKHFIARADAKAVQNSEGHYMPSRERDDVTHRYTGPLLPWTMKDFADHFTGAATYGHYLLSTDSQCKIFAFDIDFKKVGRIPAQPLPSNEMELESWGNSFYEASLREVWLDRSHPAREWLKIAMRTMAAKLADGIEWLEIPHLTSYTGSKGLHVYGMTGKIPAEDALAGAHFVLDHIGGFEPSKGNVFFQWANQSDPELSLFEVEVFPKQTHIDEDGFGNLIRLPYGLNAKSSDPTFFIDETLPFSRIEPATLGQVINSITQQVN